MQLTQTFNLLKVLFRSYDESYMRFLVPTIFSVLSLLATVCLYAILNLDYQAGFANVFMGLFLFICALLVFVVVGSSIWAMDNITKLSKKFLCLHKEKCLTYGKSHKLRLKIVVSKQPLIYNMNNVFFVEAGTNLVYASIVIDILVSLFLTF